MGIDSRKEEILQDLLKEQGVRINPETGQVDEEWAREAQEDMLEWIELQGIYIRQ